MFRKLTIITVKKKQKKNITEFFFFLEMKLVFFGMFFYLPKLNDFFRKWATIQSARWAEKNTCFFGNARSKSNARAHLRQRKKNIVALRS